MFTGRLVRLRVLEPGDTEALWRWHNDPEVMRWLDDGFPMSLAQATAKAEKRPPNSYGNMLFGIESIAGQHLVGVARLRDADPVVAVAELDIYIGKKDCWGQGYGTEATRLICRYGFDKMRLHRIGLTVVTENEAAIRVYRRVGFVEEGRLRQTFHRDGQWYDMLAMGLLAGELRD